MSEILEIIFCYIFLFIWVDFRHWWVRHYLDNCLTIPKTLFHSFYSPQHNVRGDCFFSKIQENSDFYFLLSEILKWQVSMKLCVKNRISTIQFLYKKSSLSFRKLSVGDSCFGIHMRYKKQCITQTFCSWNCQVLPKVIWKWHV